MHRLTSSHLAWHTYPEHTIDTQFVSLGNSQLSELHLETTSY